MKIKPALIFGILAVLIILVTFFSILTFGPETEEFKAGDVLDFRRLKNRMLSQKVGAPFYQVAGFDSLVYYPPNPGERFLAEVIPVKEGEELDLMPDRPGYPSHRVAGYAVLKKDIWTDTLFILKDLDETSDTLFFVPFSDPGNGKESYGGGRYLDLVIKPGKPVQIDFNYAYNPYCAYDASFVCARIPGFNRMSREMEAGEKDYPHTDSSSVAFPH
jgi:uncharacterized protein (DUF1684 family)